MRRTSGRSLPPTEAVHGEGACETEFADWRHQGRESVRTPLPNGLQTLTGGVVMESIATTRYLKNGAVGPRLISQTGAAGRTRALGNLVRSSGGCYSLPFLICTPFFGIGL
jgi:hypothetical protein